MLSFLIKLKFGGRHIELPEIFLVSSSNQQNFITRAIKLIFCANFFLYVPHFPFFSRFLFYSTISISCNFSHSLMNYLFQVGVFQGFEPFSSSLLNEAEYTRKTEFFRQQALFFAVGLCSSMS